MEFLWNRIKYFIFSMGCISYKYKNLEAAVIQNFSVGQSCLLGAFSLSNLDFWWLVCPQTFCSVMHLSF